MDSSAHSGAAGLSRRAAGLSPRSDGERTRPLVYVIGAGMGNPQTLTVAACEALAASELIVGSARLLEGLGAYEARKVAHVRSADIVRELRASGARVASVVMSGDVGLHSGATGLYELLDGFDVRVISGVSSLSYLCARVQVPWQDARVVSVHGRAGDVEGAVQTNRKTFVLTGGAVRAGDVCARLTARGLGNVRVFVGERLSYADERVTCGTAAELAGQAFDGLAAMLVIHEGVQEGGPAAPCLGDEAFVRGEVPMTKEEVRALAVCKLRVLSAHVVWDVGAGTGSVSVELARAARAGVVCAVERDAVACALVQENARRLGVGNVRVVEGVAPEALAGLPVPDRVFVGGSCGRLGDILRAVVETNPCVRVCVSAIVIETLAEALRVMDELGMVHVDVTQVSIAKGRLVGGRHMMRGANPVYLVTADGPGCGEEVLS